MKYFFKVCFLTFLWSQCYAQSDMVSDSTAVTAGDFLYEQAVAMGDALIHDDYETFIQFNPPTLVALMGGKEKMISKMQQGMKEMNNQGTRFLSIAFDEPSPMIRVKSELQCTLLQETTMKIPKGKLISKSTLIAISADEGQHWHFIDAGGKDLQALQKIFTNLSTELVIPAKQQPLFYPD